MYKLFDETIFSFSVIFIVSLLLARIQENLLLNIFISNNCLMRIYIVTDSSLQLVQISKNFTLNAVELI